MKMTENQLNALRRERSRLLDAWRNAEGSNKMAILVRIGDIDEELGKYADKAAEKAARPRRFFR